MKIILNPVLFGLGLFVLSVTSYAEVQGKLKHVEVTQSNVNWKVMSEYNKAQTSLNEVRNRVAKEVQEETAKPNPDYKKLASLACDEGIPTIENMIANDESMLPLLKVGSSEHAEISDNLSINKPLIVTLRGVCQDYKSKAQQYVTLPSSIKVITKKDQ